MWLPRGVNLPWLRYGGDFGANAWSPAGGLSKRDLGDLDRALAAAAAAGAEVIRWFVLADGRAGITFDEAGAPERLQAVVLDDMRTALDRLAAHGLRMVPVLFDFTWADAPRLVNGVSLGGRAPVLRDPVARHAWWRVVDALVTPFARHRGIAMWDLWNEPEWMTAPWRPPARRLSPRRLRQCLSELVLHLRWSATQPLTVGLASARGLPLCRDLGLDVLQVHWYDHLERRAPLSPRARVAWSEAPLVLGEFPTSGSARDADTIAALALDAGYAAAWPWSLLADDRSSNRTATLQSLAHARDDRNT